MYCPKSSFRSMYQCCGICQCYRKTVTQPSMAFNWRYLNISIFWHVMLSLSNFIFIQIMKKWLRHIDDMNLWPGWRFFSQDQILNFYPLPTICLQCHANPVCTSLYQPCILTQQSCSMWPPHLVWPKTSYPGSLTGWQINSIIHSSRGAWTGRRRTTNGMD